MKWQHSFIAALIVAVGTVALICFVSPSPSPQELFEDPEKLLKNADADLSESESNAKFASAMKKQAQLNKIPGLEAELKKLRSGGGEKLSAVIQKTRANQKIDELQQPESSQELSMTEDAGPLASTGHHKVQAFIYTAKGPAQKYRKDMSTAVSEIREEAALKAARIVAKAEIATARLEAKAMLSAAKLKAQNVLRSTLSEEENKDENSGSQQQPKAPGIRAALSEEENKDENSGSQQQPKAPSIRQQKVQKNPTLAVNSNGDLVSIVHHYKAKQIKKIFSAPKIQNAKEAPTVVKSKPIATPHKSNTKRKALPLKAQPLKIRRADRSFFADRYIPATETTLDITG